MGIAILLISIMIPSVSAIALTIFIMLFLVNNRIRIAANKSGTLIYIFDPKSRSYKMSDSTFNQKPYFKNEKFTGWKNISDLYTNVITEPDDQKTFRALLQKIDKGIDYVDFSVNKKISKKKSVNFKFAFTKDQETDYYVCIESWTTLINRKKHSKKQWEPTSEEDIYNGKDLYTGFVAFNLNPTEIDSDKNLLSIVENINLSSGFRHLNSNEYILNNGNLIFILTGSSKKKIRNKINKFIKVFNSIKTKALGNRFYTGSAVAYTKNVTTKKTLNKMYATLDFLLNKSIADNEPFLSHANNLDKEKFNSFAEASRVLRHSIAEGEVSFKKKPVRYWTTNKKITEYVKPEIKSLNQTMIDNLARNTNNKNMLLDSVSQSVAIDNKTDSPVLVDVRDEWLLKHADEINYKKAIYVINYNQNKSTDALREVIAKLKKRNFVFALKIKKYNEDVSLLLEYLEPQFLVISKLMKNDNGLYGSKTLLNLMTLNNVCSIKKIKIIYDNPPIHLDKSITEKIGLKFFYK